MKPASFKLKQLPCLRGEKNNMQVSPLQQDKLRRLAEAKDPSLRAMRFMAETMGKIDVVKGKQGEKGDIGHTPIKGYDYFTDEEINSIISYIQSNVKNGVNGKNGINGINGYSPVRGKDYWTKEDISKIRKDIEKLIPKIQKESPVDIQEIIKELKKQPIEAKNIEGLPDVKELSHLVKFLKAGGFRGGGDTVVAGTNVTITTNANGQKVITSSGGGGGGTSISNASGTVDGANTTFTVSSTPNYILCDGSTYFENYGYTLSGLAVTMAFAPVSYVKYASGASVTDAGGTVDGANTTFTAASTPNYVFIDGGTYFENYGYTYSGGIITTAFVPVSYVKYS